MTVGIRTHAGPWHLPHLRLPRLTFPRLHLPRPRLHRRSLVWARDLAILLLCALLAGGLIGLQRHAWPSAPATTSEPWG